MKKLFGAESFALRPKLGTALELGTRKRAGGGGSPPLSFGHNSRKS